VSVWVQRAVVGAAWASLAAVCACQLDARAPALGSQRETMSDVNHGAAAAAADAMDRLTTDPEPDTEAHLLLSRSRPATADDSTKADLLLLNIREALRKYADVRIAAADGFEELPATEGKHTVHHLSNWGWARGEAREFNPAHPTSLLYREGADGTLALIGAMYTAPARSTIQELDARIPVSLARWHRHVNWCAPKSSSGAQWLTVHEGAPVFGPRSSIATREACEAAGGVFYPGVFGWMVHVTFVGSDDPRVVWNGFLPSAPEPAQDHDSDHRQAAQAAVAPPPPEVPALHSPPVTALRRHDSPPTQSASTPSTTETQSIGVATPTPPRGALSGIQSAAPVARTRPPGGPPMTPPSGPQSPTVFAPSARISTTFVSGHRDITYDRFTPQGGGSHPAILLLHAEGGLPLQQDRFEEFAATLVKRDYVVEIVHYFDRTGTIAASQPDRLVHFREWEGTVRDAVTDLANAPGVDSTRMGIFGTGLGASLALSLGAHDSRIRAVAEYEGSLPVWAAATVRRMPAVFIGESDADSPAAVLEANRVRALCQAANAPVELEIYAAPKNQGRGNGIRDLRQRALAFLEQHLKGR
jgi:dienelactone hydrolase